ncbi:MAG: hypothetical protein WBV28_16425 [Terracidiphilus sp.]
MRIGSARALKQQAYSFARDSLILADFTSAQQLAVEHFVVAGTAVSTTRDCQIHRRMSMKVVAKARLGWEVNVTN